MKRKIFSVAMLACVLAIAVMGATTAYFTDTKTAVNTFTAGNVTISMTELDADGAKKTVGENFTLDYGTLYPGRVIKKNPTVTVGNDSEDAYIAARIVVSNGKTVDDAIGSLISSIAADKAFLTGGLLSETSNVVVDKKVNTTTGDYEYYILLTTKQAKNAEVLLFENVI